MPQTQITRARVQLTIEIELPDTWGDDCTMEQVHKQSVESAIQQCRLGLVIGGLTAGPIHADAKKHAAIIGTPKITAILVDR